MLVRRGQNERDKTMVLTPEEMHDKVCEPRFKVLHDGQEEIKKIANATHKALCVSNGGPSVLSRLERIEAGSEGKKATKTFMKGLLRFEPIESRDVPRIIFAAGMVILVLEKLGLLMPLIKIFK